VTTHASWRAPDDTEPLSDAGRHRPLLACKSVGRRQACTVTLADILKTWPVTSKASRAQTRDTAERAKDTLCGADALGCPTLPPGHSGCGKGAGSGRPRSPSSSSILEMTRLLSGEKWRSVPSRYTPLAHENSCMEKWVRVHSRHCPACNWQAAAARGGTTEGAAGHQQQQHASPTCGQFMGPTSAVRCHDAPPSLLL